MPVDHLDEGTIHAWLDQALSQEEAETVAAHVAQCLTCQAAVAEARGFIAAASRIVSTLDDVPAHVIPSSALHRARSPRRSVRHWPWAAAAAGVLIAIGLTVRHRASSGNATSPVTVPALTPMPPVTSTAPAEGGTPPAPKVRLQMAPVAPPRPVGPPPLSSPALGTPAAPNDSVARARVEDAGVAAASAKAATADAQQRPLLSVAPTSARAMASPVPRRRTRCDALRVMLARTKTDTVIGDSLTTAQRDSLNACPK